VIGVGSVAWYLVCSYPYFTTVIRIGFKESPGNNIIELPSDPAQWIDEFQTMLRLTQQHNGGRSLHEQVVEMLARAPPPDVSSGREHERVRQNRPVG
jgi:hypothetical protein